MRIVRLVTRKAVRLKGSEPRDEFVPSSTVRLLAVGRDVVIRRSGLPDVHVREPNIAQVDIDAADGCVCDQCGFAAANTQGLSAHMRRVHGPRKDPTDMSKLSIRDFVAIEQGAGEVVIHADGRREVIPASQVQATAEPPPPPSVPAPASMASIDGAFGCEECGRGFRTIQALRSHMGIKHKVAADMPGDDTPDESTEVA